MSIRRDTTARRRGLPFRVQRRVDRRAATSTGAAAAVAALLLAGCAAVGPDNVRPVMELPAAYREAGPWVLASPGVVDVHRDWWAQFNDPSLTMLVAQADRSNQNLRVAEAQYRAARATAAQARSAYWPNVTAAAGSTRARSAVLDSGGVRLGNDQSLVLSTSWVPDFWGAVRRSVEASDASLQASAADLANAQLSIRAELVQDVLQLRITDLERALYDKTVAAYAKSLQLARSQYAAGTALGSDVALAESTLKTAQVQAAALESTRSQLEHAIAVLTGQAPASFGLPPAGRTADDLQASLPAVPVGLPSQLLQRRPDIAGAERRAAAANAQIGVAEAAYYPSLTLSGSGGVESNSLSTLFDTPSRVWSLGANLAQTVFDGGRRRAQTDQAIAAHDAAAAQYKQTVLGGFQQVEDNLAILRVLDNETRLQADAVAASQRAERSAYSQYRAGTGTYLNLLTAQTQLLASQQSALQILGNQLTASVNLITAVGGGWTAADGAPALASAEPATRSTQ